VKKLVGLLVILLLIPVSAYSAVKVMNDTGSGLLDNYDCSFKYVDYDGSGSNIYCVKDVGSYDSCLGGFTNYRTYGTESVQWDWGCMSYCIHQTSRLYYTLDLNQLPIGSVIDSAYFNFSSMFDGAMGIRLYYAGDEPFNFSLSNSSGYYYTTNQTCGNHFGNITEPCNSTPFYVYDWTTCPVNHNFDVTELVKYGYLSPSKIIQIAVVPDETFGLLPTGNACNLNKNVCGVGVININGNVTYTGTNAFTIFYQAPNHSSYASNVTVLGQQVGGFLGGLQGLLSFLLGLIIVGVVGMFFYAVFFVVTGSVKRGFKR
jgi:hypothetical protein